MLPPVTKQQLAAMWELTWNGLTHVHGKDDRTSRRRMITFVLCGIVRRHTTSNRTNRPTSSGAYGFVTTRTIELAGDTQSLPCHVGLYRSASHDE
ncbi:hypothetical protein BHE74_00009735 [Ensete ventricosum]|nr:hypothetical protein BHE74_00009735 [Ensete ventricosum]